MGNFPWSSLSSPWSSLNFPWWIVNSPWGKLNIYWWIVDFPWGKLNTPWGIVDPDQGRFDLQRARLEILTRLFRGRPLVSLDVLQLWILVNVREPLSQKGKVR